MRAPLFKTANTLISLLNLNLTTYGTNEDDEELEKHFMQLFGDTSMLDSLFKQNA
jgi:hypothetical protein